MYGPCDAPWREFGAGSSRAAMHDSAVTLAVVVTRTLCLLASVGYLTLSYSKALRTSHNGPYPYDTRCALGPGNLVHERRDCSMKKNIIKGYRCAGNKGNLHLDFSAHK
ncbi:hypothetical protein LX36DRAFT_660817 [Colletotrichum falcatum]|nr:hypothetical protein LX36DRAFT_660817 [Colletotrichum falcatum]